jgi:hypothetical protein
MLLQNITMLILEFAIKRTVMRRFDVDEKHFKDALDFITPPPLKETGFPFDKENVLHAKQYVLALWKFFFMREEPESLAYTGRFIDSLTVTNYKNNYSVTERKGKKRSASETDTTTIKKTRSNECHTIFPH